MPFSSCSKSTSGSATGSHAVTWSRRARIEFTFQLAILMLSPKLRSSWNLIVLQGTNQGGGRLHGSMVARHQNHHDQDSHWNESQGGVVEDRSGQMSFALAPVAQLRPVFHADLLKMLKIVGKVASLCIPVDGVPLQCTIENFLKLGRDGGISDTGRHGVVEQAIVNHLHRRGAGKGKLSREHFIQDDTHGIDV